jgi:hypothetical protein
LKVLAIMKQKLQRTDTAKYYSLERTCAAQAADIATFERTVDSLEVELDTERAQSAVLAAWLSEKSSEKIWVPTEGEGRGLAHDMKLRLLCLKLLQCFVPPESLCEVRVVVVYTYVYVCLYTHTHTHTHTHLYIYTYTSCCSCFCDCLSQVLASVAEAHFEDAPSLLEKMRLPDSGTFGRSMRTEMCEVNDATAALKVGKCKIICQGSDATPQNQEEFSGESARDR